MSNGGLEIWNKKYFESLCLVLWGVGEEIIRPKTEDWAIQASWLTNTCKSFLPIGCPLQSPLQLVFACSLHINIYRASQQTIAFNVIEQSSIHLHTGNCYFDTWLLGHFSLLLLFVNLPIRASFAHPWVGWGQTEVSLSYQGVG